MHPRTTELLDHLERNRVILREAVASVPAERHAIAPAPGRWSVLAVLEHLVLLERRITGVLQRLIDEAKAAGIGQETDHSPVLPTIDLAPVLDRSGRISAPEAVHPREIRELPVIWDALASSRAGLHRMIEGADGIAMREISFPHPVFGPLDLYTWLAFIGAHEARHADQIREIGASLASVA